MTATELKHYLDARQMSSTEFAEIIGVTRGAVLHWLAGRRDIPLTVVKIIEFFNRPDLDIGLLRHYG